MDCTKCISKECRNSSPCLDRSSEYIHNYFLDENSQYTKAASSLIDNGRAGTLTRIEEIVEYSKIRGYKNLGVAYCYGMEKEALLLREYLLVHGFKLNMVSCTVDGIKEAQLDNNKTKQTVSCNPLGQANILNSSGVEMTILIGLCLGHDILLQNNLKMDFTTFVVKDRVLYHNPLLALSGIKSTEDRFLENLPGNFNLIKVEDFITKLADRKKSPEDIYLIDLRNAEAFNKEAIPGSINCSLSDLPSQYKQLIPDRKKEIIVYCNGGIQSVYAVMYLSLKGYNKVFSLAGGFSKFLQSK